MSLVEVVYTSGGLISCLARPLCRCVPMWVEGPPKDLARLRGLFSKFFCRRHCDGLVVALANIFDTCYVRIKAFMLSRRSLCGASLLITEKSMAPSNFTTTSCLLCVSRSSTRTSELGFLSKKLKRRYETRRSHPIDL